MKFRYLIAVPYTSHGSDLLEYKEEVVASTRIIKVTPVAPLSVLDFSVLCKGFEQLPSRLISAPSAQFSLDSDKNVISYSGIPDPSFFYEYYLYPQRLLTLVAERFVTVGRLRSFIREIAGNVDTASHKDLVVAIEQFGLMLTDAIPYLMISAITDELIFENTANLLSEQTESVHSNLFTLVFSSRFTRHNATYPPELLRRKRIVLPSSEFFMTIDAENIYTEYEANNIAFTKHLNALKINDISELNLLWLCRVFYEMSEELFGLWASSICLMSSLITRLSAMRRYSDRAYIYAQTLESLLHS